MSIPRLRLPMPLDVGGHRRDLATVSRRAASLAGIVALHALGLVTEP